MGLLSGLPGKHQILRVSSNNQRESSKFETVKPDSGVQPGLEEGIQALQHLFVDSLDARETAPKAEIQFLNHPLELRDELFYQSTLVTVLLPEMLLAGLRRLF